MPNASVTFRIESAAIAGLARRLAEVDRKAARKAIRQGINEASKLVLADAKAGVPVRSGQLRKSLGRKVRATKDGKVIYGVIKPRAGAWVKDQPGLVGRRKGGKVFVNKWRVKYKGRVINPVKYAHLVEYGHKMVGHKPGKKVVGFVAPRPFLRPAWERNRQRVTGLILKYLNRAVQAFFARARSGRGKKSASGNYRR